MDTGFSKGSIKDTQVSLDGILFDIRVVRDSLGVMAMVTATETRPGEDAGEDSHLYVIS